jgi:phosphoribosylamine--glycine ligase
MPRKVAAIGKSGRLDAIAQALLNSVHSPEVHVLSDVVNKGLSSSATKVYRGASDDWAVVRDFVDHVSPDLVVVGPEEPLAAGIVDKLVARGIACVGPNKTLAKLETSKSFTRRLLAKHDIPGNPEHRVFFSNDGIKEYLHTLSNFVVKPDGLTGGKGVKVSGEHLQSFADAIRYCEEILAGNQPVIIEEKLDGEEFSFQSFFDGKNIAHTFPIQDHKRARDNDTGPNTGGMGTYSCANHSLPFLTEADVREAEKINCMVGEKLFAETGEKYKGILYGGFMLTKNGLRVIEYNARFGDPEAMNVLPLLETDFLDVCDAITGGTLDQLSVQFQKMATVCKYVVPIEYPGKSTSNATIDVSKLTKLQSSESRLRVYYGAVEDDGENLLLTGSRAIAVVGIGSTLVEAERVAERAACAIEGPVYHRRDIGTAQLVQKRCDHIAKIMPHSRPKLRYVG